MIGYVCYILSLTPLFAAFQLFTLLWADTLRFEQKTLTIAYCVVAFALIIYTGQGIAFIVELILFNLVATGSQTVLMGKFWTIGGAGWFFVASVLYLTYGLKVSYVLRGFIGGHAWGTVLQRLNYTMVLCTLCSMSRVIMLSYLTFQTYGYVSPIPWLLWLLFAQWIPFYGLSTIMLLGTRLVTKPDEHFSVSKVSVSKPESLTPLIHSTELSSQTSLSVSYSNLEMETEKS